MKTSNRNAANNYHNRSTTQLCRKLCGNFRRKLCCNFRVCTGEAARQAMFGFNLRKQEQKVAILSHLSATGAFAGKVHLNHSSTDTIYCHGFEPQSRPDIWAKRALVSDETGPGSGEVNAPVAMLGAPFAESRGREGRKYTRERGRPRPRFVRHQPLSGTTSPSPQVQPLSVCSCERERAREKKG